jgi:Arc/MetJ-type ribon-helix-helix transcriptional regulator
MRGIRDQAPLRSSGMPRSKTDDQVRDALRAAVASHRLEGIEVTAEEQELIARHLRGELSDSEFLELALAHARRRAGGAT